MQPGELVAHRFLIEGLAGSGGMGSVFRAHDLQEERPAAIKVVHIRQPRDIARFDVETRLLAELHHPGIVHYLTHGFTAAGEPFLAMEWLDGEDLAARLSRGRLAIDESVALILAVAEALATAHARGVVHRDIKPGNLFLVEGALERVRLLDFGIARFGLASPRLTETGVALGTPGYMAPEQARGAAEVDARADVFALGAVLFECLTGQPAFMGQHVMAVLAKVLFEDPPLLREVRREVPAMLEAIVACMLAKDPADRPANAAEVAEALASLASSEPVPRAPVLTRGEQRLLSIIAARVEDRGGATPEATLALDAGPKALEAAVMPFGARMERLADGSMLAVLVDTGNAADQAARAARCALRIAERAPEASIAIVTGLGELEKRIPVGQVIDKADALLGAAPPRAVLLDEVTAGLLDIRFQVMAGPAGLMLCGENESIEAPRPLLGKPSPCVGRDRELRVLLDLLDESVGESVARAVLVTGPPGIGKSRLRQEFVLEVHRRLPGVDTWIGRGDAMSAGSAFALVGSAIRRAAGILGAEPVDDRRRKLVDRVARQVAEKDVRRVAEFLGEMTGTPFPDAESVKLRAARQEARLMADQIGHAWASFLAAACSAQPLLLVLDDLHWGDFASVKLIDTALRELKGRPLLAAAFGRPEVHERFPRLWAERGLSELRLGELTSRAAEELARNALGNAAGPQTIRRVVERSAGHPFFLEELIRAVAEGCGDALPETVLAMVEARLSALPPEARRVLRAASVFGDVFWRSGVEALLGPLDDMSHVDEWLALLVEREVVLRCPSSGLPEQEPYTFRHSLLREGAYATLREADRVLGHRLAAEWLERSGASDAVSLAEHFERGEAPERAVKWYLAAARQMIVGNDLRAAIASAERGLRSGAAGEVRAELFLVLMMGHVWSADWAAFFMAAHEVLREATPGDPHWCAATLGKVVVTLLVGAPDEQIADDLRTVCDVEPSPERSWMMLDNLGYVHSVLTGLGRRDLAALCAARMEQLGSDVAARDPLIRARLQNMRSISLEFEGDFWASLRAAQEACAAFEEAGYQIKTAVARISIAQAYRLLGAHARAERSLRSVLCADGNALGLVWMWATLLLSVVLAERGALEEARELLASLVSSEQVRSTPYYEGRTRWALSYVFWYLGEHGEAEREARLAIECLAPPSPTRAAAQATLAAALLELGRASEALGIVEEVVRVHETAGALHPFDAFVHVTYAKALRATGDHARAGAVLRETRVGLLVQAAKIGDPELRRSFLQNVPENAQVFTLADAA